MDAQEPQLPQDELYKKVKAEIDALQPDSYIK